MIIATWEQIVLTPQPLVSTQTPLNFAVGFQDIMQGDGHGHLKQLERHDGMIFDV
jgi:hypothetical protein